MDVQLAQVLPLLARQLKPTETARVQGWLAGLNGLLTARYGVVAATSRPVFLVYIADAIQRRLDKPKQLVDSENAGPFGVRWNQASSLGAWFLPAEEAAMDTLAGHGVTRTYRTPAPDNIRLINRVDTFAPVDELEAEARAVLRGSDVPLD